MTEQERRVVNHAMKILEQSQDDEARALACKAVSVKQTMIGVEVKYNKDKE